MILAVFRPIRSCCAHPVIRCGWIRSRMPISHNGCNRVKRKHSLFPIRWMENRIWSSSILNNARAQNLANVRLHPHSMANDGHMTVICLTHDGHMPDTCLTHDRQARTNARLDGDGEGGRSQTCRYHIQHLETCPESE